MSTPRFGNAAAQMARQSRVIPSLAKASPPNVSTWVNWDLHIPVPSATAQQESLSLEENRHGTDR